MSRTQGNSTLELKVAGQSCAPSIARQFMSLMPLDLHFRRNFVHLWSNHYLLYALTIRGIRARYKQSLIGVGWALITPMAMTAVFAYIYTRADLDKQVLFPAPTILYLLFSLAFWNFFSRAVTNGSTALVSNMDLVTKIYFPREVLPISSVLMNLVDFALAFSMFVIVSIGYTFLYPHAAVLFPGHYPFLPHVGWLWIPVLLFFLLLFTLGVAFFTAAFQVYFRDVSHLINLGMFLWLVLTPVLYPLHTLAGGRRTTLISLNPMTGLIDGLQLAVFARQWPWSHVTIYAAAFSVCTFLAGYCFFKHEERYFADVV